MAKATKNLTASQEDYLEAIWALIWKDGIARVRDIADRLAVSMPSVSGALKTLARQQLVEYSPHRYVTLTDRGMELAGKISARHGTLRKFLTDVLGVEADLADSNACRIEHAVDQVVLRRLGHLVEFMSDSPMTKRWPERFGTFCARRNAAARVATQPDPGAEPPPDAGRQDLPTLADVKPGQKARIVRVDRPPGRARKLAAAGVSPGSVVRVARVAPLGDPIELRTRQHRLSLRRTEARDIPVERLP